MRKVQKQLETIAALLREETTLSLATTAENGEPTVAPLFYIADEELILYWLSSEGSRHSLNLRRTPRASAAVYHCAWSWRQIRGVQMSGRVSLVADPKRRGVLLEVYSKRFKLGRAFRPLLGRSALYAFEPEFFRFIDNAAGFGSKFELTRGPEGWTLAGR